MCEQNAKIRGKRSRLPLCSIKKLRSIQCCGASSLSEKPCRLFRQFFAVCCAHNLFALGEQIPHLQPEKCFSPRTRRGRKRFELYSPLSRRTLRGFFDSLKAPQHSMLRSFFYALVFFFLIYSPAPVAKTAARLISSQGTVLSCTRAMASSPGSSAATA